MTEDPHVREIGRLADDQGRIVIVGVSYDRVTLRTLGTRTGGAAGLDAEQQEELSQLIVAAIWAAIRGRVHMNADAAVMAAGIASLP